MATAEYFALVKQIDFDYLYSGMWYSFDQQGTVPENIPYQ
jgi:hypothetical protein